jgi:ATP-dependent RNA helicase DeaD
MEGVRIAVVYGGQPIDRQIMQLKKKPQIVVATPGRLMDHYKRRTLRLDQVQTVVLDECDRMLDMGFVRDVTRILDLMPKRRNLALMSATISREVMDIALVYQRDAVEIVVRPDEENKPDILQYRIQVRERQGGPMIQILEQAITTGSLLLQHKSMVERLTNAPDERSPADCIHGICGSKTRKVMSQFRKGTCAFGRDRRRLPRDRVEDVDAVFNYDVPDENEYYIHRIGRTGRAKKHGVAYTFVSNIASGIRLDEIARNTKSEIVPAALDAQGNFVPLENGK